ncbi:hypothetical protein AQUSIP_21960 [Aquicella siphonis]|uniref:Ubiquinone biosynthesis accessory factor UbiJ n=1 Tax=Aquicella siphonis TaxID=254247 RepID=A0A5E4PII9_9COXI|nr:SCP2 sterol-binding domain-containing protein [Aquicella siphonis]VVC76869.1 hypothetical protein AQUSIP_21960 [Aquicella siphonis]
MNQTFLNFLSRAMNACLDLDPDSRKRIKKMHGKCISIELLPLHFVFQCTFDDTAIHLHTGENQAAETRLRGTPLQMLGIMLNQENRQRFFAEDVVIEGNAELGQQVIELFDHLQIDWEEHLSRLIGDAPAYHAGRLMNRVQSWLKDTQDNLAMDINGYIHEEAKWLPAREALQDFFSEIDAIRMDVDRAEASILHLQSIISKKEDVQ